VILMLGTNGLKGLIFFSPLDIIAQVAYILLVGMPISAAAKKLAF
jgi:hypothetical protein